MRLNLFGVTSAQFVLLIERLDVTYFPKDCLQSASRNKLQSFLIGYISKSCPRCTWSVFSMCHSFLLSWHFHLVISDQLRQTMRPLWFQASCTCVRCVPPLETECTGEALTYSQVILYSKQILELMSNNKTWGKMLLVRTNVNCIIHISTEIILNFSLATH